MSENRFANEAQFIYWNLRRGMLSQSGIARKFHITRQSVSKSVKIQERNVVIRLLDCAQVSGIMPTYYDPVLGILIGLIPPIGNLRCILLIDDKNDSRIFYDPAANPDIDSRLSSQKELNDILNTVCITKDFNGMNFEKAIDLLKKMKRGV